jgi:hypothetical protein
MRHVVAAAIVLVLAAGCGSDEPPSKVEPTRSVKSAAAMATSFADRIKGACLQRNNELRQLSRPRNKRQFAGYVASMLNIVRYYRGQLAALHPAGDRRSFARYVRLLRADEASAVRLLQAVRRSDRRAVVRLVSRQRQRSELEQVLLTRLGVSC